MSVWNYTNVGASPKPEFKKHVEKIFDYIGYASDYESVMEGDDFYPDPDDVYRCKDSNYEKYRGHIKAAFWEYDYDERDLFNILNALFPKTTVFIHHSEGNSLGWVSHDECFDADSMTYSTADDEYNDDFDEEFEEEFEEETDEDETDVDDAAGEEPIKMKLPKPEHIEALIDLSMADGNDELTALLLELKKKL